MNKRWTLITRTGEFKFATLKDAKYSSRDLIRTQKWFKIVDSDGSIMFQGEDQIS